ncbi:hypothetical protein OG828_47205 [Streptomyces sp. NBC_00457]|uniref:AraC-like ligand-binding domain-containing protein n=1 Tax=Streptomyces sp. NBC_00457 TaxID=2975748 RepID=UPI002E23D3CF
MRQTLLSRWPLAQCPDPAEAMRSVNALMAPASVRGIEALSSEPGYFRLNGFADQDFAVGFISTDLGLKANVSAERDPSYFLAFGVFGEMPLEVGKRQLSSTRSVAAVVNPDERLLVLPERQPTGSLAIRLGRRFVDRELTALAGKDPGSDVRFDPVLDLSRPGPSAVRELLGGMLTQFDSEHEVLTRPAMRRAEMRLIVTSLLLRPSKPGPLGWARTPSGLASVVSGYDSADPIPAVGGIRLAFGGGAGGDFARIASVKVLDATTLA